MDKKFVMVEQVGGSWVAFSYVSYDPGASRQRDVEVVRPVGGARYARTYPMGGRYGAYSEDADDERFADYHAAIDAQIARAYTAKGVREINRPWSHGVVADAEAIAEMQSHHRHWRALRQHVVRWPS